jgi:hypothetical protein
MRQFEFSSFHNSQTAKKTKNPEEDNAKPQTPPLQRKEAAQGGAVTTDPVAGRPGRKDCVRFDA